MKSLNQESLKKVIGGSLFMPKQPHEIQVITPQG
ncbi:hypothetical protein N476_23095 [Pseudoalteromonas luteoviolacea H33]|uniref:Uncharacterized protein n=1 Tax=Pseudoalteromonas luteoviolacea H33 TaxID=1365251 RepID=A0A167CIA7_9GAMM|nr:hypothetical protein N476_23095 [Pseudoalteromonas luteoviolacea H33]KZN75727.1 hypothetical protein N477_17420 [Pseudoalteromonas luteoviolacea H33-S]